MTESRFAFLENHPHFPAALAKKAQEAERDYPERYGASLTAARAAAEKITEFLLAQTGLPVKGSIANPFYSPDNPRSKPELDLSKQSDRLFALLKEDAVSYQDKSERFDFIRLKGNAAAHEDADNPYTEADAAAALEHLYILCRSLAERYPAPQPPRRPRHFAAAEPAAPPTVRRNVRPAAQGGGTAKKFGIITAAALGIPFAIYLMTAPRGSRPTQPEAPAADSFQAASSAAAESNILRYPDGSVYQGEIVGGKAESANGKITYPDGSVCEGRFADGRLNGEALCRYADGSAYQGGFADGVRSGQGKAVYADGGRYTGSFAAGEPEGIGEIAAGQNSYTGRVSGRSPAGEGVLVLSDGNRCTGSFTAAAADCRFADGSRYQGGFDGKSLNFHGQGSLSDAAGKTRFKGEWQQGIGRCRSAKHPGLSLFAGQRHPERRPAGRAVVPQGRHAGQRCRPVQPRRAVRTGARRGPEYRTGTPVVRPRRRAGAHRRCRTSGRTRPFSRSPAHRRRPQRRRCHRRIVLNIQQPFAIRKGSLKTVLKIFRLPFCLPECFSGCPGCFGRYQ